MLRAVLFLWLAVAGLQTAQSSGSIGVQPKTCLCQGVQRQSVNGRDIASVTVYPKAVFCMNLEIIVTLKSGKKICVDSKGRLGTWFLSGHRPGKKGNQPKRNKKGGRKREQSPLLSGRLTLSS